MALLIAVLFCVAAADSIEYKEYEAFAYATCPNIECKVSIFEYCAAASIGRIFEEYLILNGFEHEATRNEKNPNTKLRLALIQNTESLFCSGLFVQRSLLSLMNTQNVQTTGHAIDLISLLEKTELHKTVKDYPFWPESYFLGSNAERGQFFQQLECAETQLSEPWLFKSNQHKGKGIVFLNDTSVIRKLFLTNDDLMHGRKEKDVRLSHNCDPTAPVHRFKVAEIVALGFPESHINAIAHIVNGGQYIAQTFVSDAMAIDGHKFSIRVFVAVLSLNPYIVLFSDGYISINTQVFDGAHISKENILSNREVSEKYTDFDGEWNWNYQQFDDYVNGQKELDFGFAFVRKELMNAARATFDAIDRKNGKFSKSTRKKLKKYLALAEKQGILSKDDNNYLWLAIDFLLTTDGRVKMLEINLHPGTRLFNDCSWIYSSAEDSESYHDWRCQSARNITKEIVDISFGLAFKKKKNMPVDRQWVEQQIDFHECLIFKDYY